MIYIALLFGHLRRSSNRSSGGGIFGVHCGRRANVGESQLFTLPRDRWLKTCT
jgi:hypothetical protein